MLGWTTERFLTSAREPEPDGFAGRYDALVSRRAGREPLAYIVGRQEFWGLSFEVSPAVLIPRPETELIVEAALERSPASIGDLAVADVCTGSGCIAIAIARDRPRARVIATDVSEAALAVAERNARRHGVGDRVVCTRADLLDGVAGPFDLIVANPPYVRERERRMLRPEVRAHEPSVALYAGPDGLDVIKRLAAQAGSRLRSGGVLIFEFGFGQDETIEEVIGGIDDLKLLRLDRDLQGIARTAIVERR